ncbi:hypothetical protein ABPG75_006936 [Micractinium tetrahymenae]
MEPAGERSPIIWLPDSILSAILVLAGPAVRPAATLVCRKWWAAIYPTPALWQELRISTEAGSAAGSADAACQWLAGKAALLQRVAPLVQHAELSLGSPSLPHSALATLVTALAPTHTANQLAELDIQAQAPLSPAATTAIAQARSLRSLRLRVSGPSPGLAAALLALPGLEQLHLSLSSTAAMRLLMRDALPLLSGLTSLALHAPLVPSLRPLTSLARLRELEADDSHGSSRPSLGMLPASAFSSLTRLCYASNRQGMDGGPCFFSCCPSRDSPAIVQARLAPESEGGLWKLMVARMALCATSPLGSLLRALGIPPDRLGRLMLHSCALEPSAFAPTGGGSGDVSSGGGGGGALQLPAAHRLIVACCDCHQPAGAEPWPGHADAGHAPLAQQAPAAEDAAAAAVDSVLRRLLAGMPRLETLNLLVLPAGFLLSVAQSGSTLRTLQVTDFAATGLPAGSYLAGLETLVLSGNRFEALPRQLASATRLTQLSLADNQQPLRLSSQTWKASSGGWPTYRPCSCQLAARCHVLRRSAWQRCCRA